MSAPPWRAPSQSFAERGARYAPDPERQILLDHLHRPRTERRALDWVHEHLCRRAFAFLSPNDRQTYLSGAGLLLSTKEAGLSLSDYSALVMPFARAYEGVLLQLAPALDVAPPQTRSGDPSPGRAGASLSRLREAIARAEANQTRARELSVALSCAWREIRHQVMHADPRHRLPYQRLADAERDIEALNLAMRRSYDYLVERHASHQPESQGRMTGGGPRRRRKAQQSSP